ncbi:MAG: GatB/YqeY domain-containing protein [Gammaproteobacteria bacterium]|nr:MAG: GatB/YqeY domain-containing protein [Gammaproteobacteria bacterium]
MSLKSQLNDDVKTALRAGDKARLVVLRMALAAIKQREVDERIELDEAQELATLEKMIKQRRESAAQYERGQREDLAAKERAEIDLLSAYLPAQLTDTEIDALVEAAIAETGAASVRDMGQVMGLLKQRAAGRADMGQVSQRVKARLAG